MRVLVYVEGESDKLALDALFRGAVADFDPPLELTFHPLGGKGKILKKGPRKAAFHLKDHPQDRVVLLPDLYPVMTSGAYVHRNVEELRVLLERSFNEAADELHLDEACRKNFAVHCLKYDLEVLLLADLELLKRRLGTDDEIERGWAHPVEDQNDDRPPKRVIEELFKKYTREKRYVATVECASLLEKSSVWVLMVSCGQCFGPFVRFLRQRSPERRSSSETEESSISE